MGKVRCVRDCTSNNYTRDLNPGFGFSGLGFAFHMRSSFHVLCSTCDGGSQAGGSAALNKGRRGLKSPAYRKSSRLCRLRLDESALADLVLARRRHVPRMGYLSRRWTSSTRGSRESLQAARHPNLSHAPAPPIFNCPQFQISHQKSKILRAFLQTSARPAPANHPPGRPAAQRAGGCPADKGCRITASQTENP